jgi:hypothetical protein
MVRHFLAICSCCGLKQNFRDHQSLEASPRSGVCGVCYAHRSPSVEQRLKKAQEHEAMLRERFEKSSAWAAKAEAEVKEARQRVAIAYKSRDRAIRILRDLNDLHILRPNGACSCGVKRNCKSAAKLYDRWTQNLIQRVDEQEERALRWRRDSSVFDDDDDWYDTVHPPITPERSDTDLA